MSKYKYKALDYYGKSFRGWVEAPSSEMAVQTLQAQGLWVHQLDEQANKLNRLNRLQQWLTADLLGGPRVKRQQFMLFCRQLATLYKAGVPLATAVHTLAEQTSVKPFRKVLAAVAEHMNGGLQFSEAVAKFPTVFPAIFVSMSRAGEESGNLDTMLNRLSVFYEKEHYTREKVKTALAYPAFLSVMTVIVVITLMIFVVPQFSRNFTEMGMVLPSPTRIVIRASNIISQIWFLFPLLTLCALIVLRRIKKHPQALYYWDRFKLEIPVFGSLRRHQILARFSRTFSTLFVAGVSILDTLTIVSKVVDNEVIERMIAESRERLRSGYSISEPFARNKLFPPMVVQMLIVGESSGSLNSVMERVADYYEAEVDSMSERLKSLLEPIVLLILAGVVGIIVMAIMLPSFSMIDQVQ